MEGERIRLHVERQKRMNAQAAQELEPAGSHRHWHPFAFRVEAGRGHWAEKMGVVEHQVDRHKLLQD